MTARKAVFISRGPPTGEEPRETTRGVPCTACSFPPRESARIREKENYYSPTARVTDTNNCFNPATKVAKGDSHEHERAKV